MGIRPAFAFGYATFAFGYSRVQNTQQKAKGKGKRQRKSAPLLPLRCGSQKQRKA
jgi:hypothetical protein